MTDEPKHAGQEYLDVAFDVQEQRRLEYVDEARKDRKSSWYGRNRTGDQPRNEYANSEVTDSPEVNGTAPETPTS